MTAGPPARTPSEAQKHGIEVPEIGRWYRSPEGKLFEVVAVDDRDGTIEMQHFDGTLEESEPDGWISMHPEAAEAPEDWSGSLDMNEEDIADRFHPLLHDWQSRIDLLEDPD